jgi:hypothetical protein
VRGLLRRHLFVDRPRPECRGVPPVRVGHILLGHGRDVGECVRAVLGRNVLLGAGRDRGERGLRRVRRRRLFERARRDPFFGVRAVRGRYIRHARWAQRLRALPAVPSGRILRHVWRDVGGRVRAVRGGALFVGPRGGGGHGVRGVRLWKLQQRSGRQQLGDVCAVRRGLLCDGCGRDTGSGYFYNFFFSRDGV